MKYETLTLEREGALATVWLDRPERRNALNGTALQEVAEVFEALQGEFDTRVVVLAGRGLSFCAGADRRDPPGAPRGGAGMRERRHQSQQGLRAVQAIERLEAITLARVHGHAIGGGLVLALACDLRVAAAGTVFQIPEVDLGVPLSWGAVPRLIAEIGAARARELILLCDRFDAGRAESLGIVQRVVPPDELDAAVLGWAQRLAAKPEVAVHMTKTQFQAYASVHPLGDVTAADGDWLREAARGGVARDSFRGGSKE
ncbi:MAG: enoyl-CoA hydratase/isomerase family protein [Myxococcota bacterium]